MFTLSTRIAVPAITLCALAASAPALAHDVHYNGRSTGIKGTLTVDAIRKDVLIVDVPMSCNGAGKEEVASSVSIASPFKLSAKTVRGYNIGDDGTAAAEAQIEQFAFQVGGTTIEATGLDSHVEATCSADSLSTKKSGGSNIGTLTINGQAQTLTGQPNQTIAIPNFGSIVINEQSDPSSKERVVTALHVKAGTSDGKIAGDLAFAIARARINCTR